MLGLVPTVKTFGIMTAENPMGRKFSNEENKERNNTLLKDLRNSHHGFIKPERGKFEGNIEHPVFIVNITKNEICALAAKYEQKSVIWGKCERYGLSTFYYLETANENIESLKDTDYKVVSVRKVFHRKDSADDFYTQTKGRKFIIPFFDEKMQDAEFKDGYIINKKTGKKVYFNPESNETEYLDETEREVLLRVTRLLEENRTGKYRWENRGIIKTVLKYNYFKVKERDYENV